MEQSQQYAFRLGWQYEHFAESELETETQLLVSENTNRHEYLLDVEITIPEPIPFLGTFELLDQNDFPTNDVYWPIFSKKAINVLRNNFRLEFSEMPLMILDDRFGFFMEAQKNPSQFYQIVAEIEDTYKRFDFLALQIPQYKNILDIKSSIYESYERDVNIVTGVTKYVFRVPEGGLPPLFRLEEDPVNLFISLEARELLKKENIRGIRYISLNGYGENGGDEIDNPVPNWT
jgi:hypothetical protein